MLFAESGHVGISNVHEHHHLSSSVLRASTTVATPAAWIRKTSFSWYRFSLFAVSSRFDTCHFFHCRSLWVLPKSHELNGGLRKTYGDVATIPFFHACSIWISDRLYVVSIASLLKNGEDSVHSEYNVWISMLVLIPLCSSMPIHPRMQGWSKYQYGLGVSSACLSQVPAVRIVVSRLSSGSDLNECEYMSGFSFLSFWSRFH